MRVLAYCRGGGFGILVLVVLLVIPGSSVLADIDCITDASGCCCVGMVGNVDCDYADMVDISDLTRLLDYLFISYTQLPNRAEANCDGDPAGLVDIGDVTRLIDYLFITYTELPECAAVYNTPPMTYITDPSGESIVYINSVLASGSGTGIPLGWIGLDLADHPHPSPGWEFEWRLYGPFHSSTYDTVPPGIFEELMDQFVKSVFRRCTGETFLVGHGHTFTVCDTTVHGVSCDTVLVDTIQASSDLGVLDTLLDVDDPFFHNDARYNRIALSSFDGTDVWTLDTADTLYDAYNDFPSDTTVQMKFIFWVRSRDPVDSLQYDPVPAFVPLTVIDPKYERDIGIADIQISYSVNGRYGDSASAFWERAIDSWSTSTGYIVNYQDASDYHLAAGPVGWDFGLVDMLSNKVLVVVNDNAHPGALMVSDIVDDLARAIREGVNVWLMGRTHLYGSEAGAPNFDVFGSIPSSTADEIEQCFGVVQTVYTGWNWHIYYNNQRIEDFTGASSLVSSSWPHLTIDSALLHRRYQWQDHYPWVDTLACLPEVGYLEAAEGVQRMYTYRSLFGQHHWLNDPDYDFDGKDVAVRYDAGAFRTVYWLFTPYSLSETSAQVAVDSMLSWLCAGFVAGAEQESQSIDRGLRQNLPAGTSAVGPRIEEAER